MGHTVETRIAQPKHRFVFLLDQAMRPFVKYPILKFVLLLLLAVSMHGGVLLSRARAWFASVRRQVSR